MAGTRLKQPLLSSPIDREQFRNLFPNSTIAAANTTTSVHPASTTAGTTDANSPSSTSATLASKTPLSSSNKRVPGAAVVGVAFACLIIGAAIAVAMLFFLSTRRKRRQADSYKRHIPSSEKGALLPQPVEDDAIKKVLSRVRDNIKNHARSYYHLEMVPVTELDESQLSGLAAAVGINASTLTGIFLNPSTREEAIRLFIAWIAISRCSDERHPTFLPDELSSLAIAMPGKDGTNSNQAALFSEWKTITGALLQQRYGKQSEEAAATARSVAEAIEELNSVLAPFVVSKVNRDRRQKNLEMIMQRSAKLAFLLFSQPGTFRFDFTGQNGVMTIFPALFQVIGDQAQTLSPPRPLWEKEIAVEGQV
ncbi:uncharacterized protein BDR25DRAFT_311775 [Lindgomyces ingoldianus]|uniref:Uncharacterized protein n=1 Tax=Lindgomyces ingoldianus TaxID=673940 RepID=A0ACB6R2Q0_9PLEO|nr:uncharacterized protein BDR25DRAFT_311775 [Lindgomyces ingoldianus]KAF2473533.1 hypothetical protein BDR25DRAFT_311775 [Lindgomyces ingoldianus]